MIHQRLMMNKDVIEWIGKPFLCARVYVCSNVDTAGGLYQFQRKRIVKVEIREALIEDLCMDLGDSSR